MKLANLPTYHDADEQPNYFEMKLQRIQERRQRSRTQGNWPTDETLKAAGRKQFNDALNYGR